MIAERNRLEELVFQRGYTVDNDGNVYNPQGIKLALSTKDGYPVVNIKCPEYSDTKHVRVHRLQAYKKFGQRIYESDLVVRHLDGDRTNNHKDNIDIGTQQDNIYDMSEQQRKNKSIPGALAMTKYTPDFLNLIRNEHHNGKTYKQISQQYGLSKSTISYIINHKYVVE